MCVYSSQRLHSTVRPATGNKTVHRVKTRLFDSEFVPAGPACLAARPIGLATFSVSAGMARICWSLVGPRHSRVLVSQAEAIVRSLTNMAATHRLKRLFKIKLYAKHQ